METPSDQADYFCPTASRDRKAGFSATAVERAMAESGDSSEDDTLSYLVATGTVHGCLCWEWPVGANNFLHGPITTAILASLFVLLDSLQRLLRGSVERI